MRVDMHAGMRAGMRVAVRVGMHVAMRVDMRVDMRVAVHVDMCMDMCVAMRVAVRVDMRVNMRAGVCVDMCVDMRRVTRMHMCADMRVAMHVDMCADVRVVMHGSHIDRGDGRENCGCAVRGFVEAHRDDCTVARHDVLDTLQGHDVMLALRERTQVIARLHAKLTRELALAEQVEAIPPAERLRDDEAHDECGQEPDHFRIGDFLRVL